MRTGRTPAHRTGTPSGWDLPVVPPPFTHQLARALLSPSSRAQRRPQPGPRRQRPVELQTLGDDVVTEIFALFLADVPSVSGQAAAGLSAIDRRTPPARSARLKGSALGASSARLVGLYLQSNDAPRGRLIRLSGVEARRGICGSAGRAEGIRCLRWIERLSRLTGLEATGAPSLRAPPVVRRRIPHNSLTFRSCRTRSYAAGVSISKKAPSSSTDTLPAADT